jgi:glutamate 5-kinase
MSELRQKILSESKRIVIKIGSRVIVEHPGFIARLAESIAMLHGERREVVVVSSGAVGTGMAVLGYAKKPASVPDRQACAAVGQIGLMQRYQTAFQERGLVAGQILLSADDFRNRPRYKNLQNTLLAMLKKGIVPIVNENDSVAVDEIKVGDNDKLSSDVALFLDADLLLVFTDEDGLFDANPKTHPEARLVRLVPEITPAVLALAGRETGSAVSTGGMASKLEAIRAVARSGRNAFLANGAKVLPHQVVRGEADGTLFLGSAKKLSSRQKWLSLVSTPKGAVVVDQGGVHALRERGRSLLPVGVTRVVGNFSAKDLIEVRGEAGEKIARGVTQYGSESLRRLLHKKSSEIQALLGPQAPAELIHKNDMVVF